MLLFITIETAPTFFKMMISSGPYDDHLRAEMYEVRVLSDKRISDLTDDMNLEIYKNKARIAAEIESNRELMEKVVKVKNDLFKTALEKWQQEELNKINDNPSEYISTNITKESSDASDAMASTNSTESMTPTESTTSPTNLQS